MSEKGMSQVLGIIVGAAVMMMAAISLILMTQGGLQNAFSGTNQQSCYSTIDTQCKTVGGSFGVPSSCDSSGSYNNVDWGPNDQTIECSKYGN